MSEMKPICVDKWQDVLMPEEGFAHKEEEEQDEELEEEEGTTDDDEYDDDDDDDQDVIAASSTWSSRREPAEDDRAIATTVREAIRLAREVRALCCRRERLLVAHAVRAQEDRSSLVATVLEFYDAFHAGLVPHQEPQIAQFVENRVDKAHFVFGGHTALGVDGLLDQWQRYTRLFPSFAMRIQAITASTMCQEQERDDPAMTTRLVETHGLCDAVVSPHVVPTLLPGVTGQLREELMDKIVGQRMKCPFTLLFYFNASGRVIRLDLHVDFWTAFHEVLTGWSLVQVAEIMGNAVIGECSVVPPVVDAIPVQWVSKKKNPEIHPVTIL